MKNISNVGSINVDISANVNSLNSGIQQAISKITSATQSIARQAQSMSSATQQASNEMSQSMQNAATSIQNITVNISNSFNTMSNSINNAGQNFSNIINALFLYKGVHELKQGMEEAIDTYNKFESANMGLRSIMEGQGRSFQGAKSFVDGYVKDGLIPLNNAVTAYKLLAARGYSDNQIQDTLVRLKDASAFGRRASLTMGQAVETAAEGLKNENSILVDNSGITKNVSKMWDDYAKKIGTTRANLSMAQKIQAEYNGVMEESRFQVGDAAKYAATLGGQMAGLSASVTQIKNAFGKILSPAAMAITMVLKTLADKFLALNPAIQGAIFGAVVGFGAVAAAILVATTAMAALAAITAVLGIELLPLLAIALAVVAAFAGLGAISGYWNKLKDSVQSMSDAAKKATGQQNNLGDAVKKSGKKAKDNLQSFDEIHKTQEDMGQGAEDAAQSITDAFNNLPSLPEIKMPSLDDMLKGLKDKFLLIFNFQFPPLPPPDASLVTQVLQSIESLIANIRAQMPVNLGFQIIDIVSPVINGITGVVKALQAQFPVRVGFQLPDMQAVLQPALSAISNFALVTVPGCFSNLANWLETNWKPVLIGVLLGIAGVVAFVFGGEIVAAVGTAGAALASFASSVVAESAVIAGATGAIQTTFAVAMGAIALGLASCRTTVLSWATTLQGAFSSAESYVRLWAVNSLAVINSWITGTSQSFVNWVNTTVSNMSIFANRATKSVIDFAQNSWNALSSFLSGSSNGVYTWAKNMVSTIYSFAVNAFNTLAQLAGAVGQKVTGTISNAAESVINSFSGIGDWASANKGWIIPTVVAVGAVGAIVATGGLAAIPEALAAGGGGAAMAQRLVPALATGTNYVPKDMLAMIHEGEAVVPKQYNPSANGNTADEIASAVGSAVLAAFQFYNQSSSNNGKVEAVLNIDGSQIARALIPLIDKEKTRIGNSAIIQST